MRNEQKAIIWNYALYQSRQKSGLQQIGAHQCLRYFLKLH